ncbi:MAG: alpha/beta fold hydrolase [bacterium]|nr:alpha/beta fold hydrolase [bacterium]MCP5065938.1 alpha/beta fold hydrolase [bacterium]
MSVLRERPGKELLSWAAQGALYGFGYLRPRVPRKLPRETDTLVFVHGLGMNRASFFPLQAYLRLMGYDAQCSRNFGIPDSIEAMAEAIGCLVERSAPEGRVTIVGHSMGGLAARWYVQRLGGDKRVDRIVTLATPHGGTYLAYNAPTTLLNQFDPEGSFIRSLNESPMPPTVELHSIVAGQDLIVVPRTAGAAPFGESVVFEDLGHMDILLSPRVFATVHLALRA